MVEQAKAKKQEEVVSISTQSSKSLVIDLEKE